MARRREPLREQSIIQISVNPRPAGILTIRKLVRLRDNHRCRRPRSTLVWHRKSSEGFLGQPSRGQLANARPAISEALYEHQVFLLTASSSGRPRDGVADVRRRSLVVSTRSRHNPVATQIDANRGFYRALVRQDPKMPFGEIGRDGRTVEWKRLRNNLGNYQSNAGAPAICQGARLP